MATRSSWIALLAAAALVAPAVSQAQLNLQQFGFGGSKAAENGANGAAQPSALNSLVQNYMGANQQVLTGQSTLASAMGMSGVASQAQSAAGMLANASGASGGVLSTSALSQLGGTQQSVSQSLMQAFTNRASAPAPAKVNKQAFTDGLASLGQGVSQYAGLQSDLGAVKNSMNMSSLLQAGSNPATAQAATYIAQSAPGQLQSLVSTLTQAVQYAKANNISVPAVATSALGSVQ
ncbi:hypothetical protein BGLT_02085 [Caballeronia glathei]|uniref:Uncharacterized protein n=1 Tax=Caballeronia glathei TaxID=60547 RepID=A0A069PBE6_9BURK|nr:hypothetical protein [Caballeronia glathei]KDR37807.1 hypothetical protein BG61_06945 [Caballeronia glathei]CDY76015.1 hypothetical protein BGLT_02085 [Caballeronia glathei]